MAPITRWTREGRAWAEHAACWARRRLRGPARVGAGAERAELGVVFVHGLYAVSAAFDPMRARVERETGAVTDAFGWTPRQGFAETVAALRRDLERRAGPTVLVGHSLGGILLRAALREGARGLDVRGIVTLGTPHAGVRRLRALAPGYREVLDPDGELVHAIRRFDAGVPQVAVAASEDPFCVPGATAAALPGAEVVWLDGVGHNELLFDDRAHAVVVRAVERWSADSASDAPPSSRSVGGREP